MRGVVLVRQGKDAEGQKDLDKCYSLNPALKATYEPMAKAARELRARDKK